MSNVIGYTAGAPEGYTAPSAHLTGWVSWEGGFQAWATPLADGYILLVSNEEGNQLAMVDDDGHPIVGNWKVAVIDEDVNPRHESEASPVNLDVALEVLISIDWKVRED